MRVKYSLCSLALFAILVSTQPLSAYEQQVEKSRDNLVKELIGKLDSADLQTVNQAAYDLGQMRAKEAVPALLGVLQSSRFLSESRHIIAQDKGGLSEWVLTDVKATIVNCLGQIVEPFPSLRSI